MGIYQNKYYTKEIEAAGQSMLKHILGNTAWEEAKKADAAKLDTVIRNHIACREDSGGLASWRLSALGIPHWGSEELDIAAETASLFLREGKSVLELRKQEGKMEYGIALPYEEEDTLAESLRGLYGQAVLEKAEEKAQHFPYHAAAVFERYFDKDYKRKQSENAEAFNWPSAVLSAMIPGSYSIELRIAPVDSGQLAKMQEEAEAVYECCSIASSLSAQTGANASLSTSYKDDILENVRDSAVGAEKVTQGDGISTSVSFTQKRLLPELLMERLKEFTERVQEGIRCGAWTVEFKVSASSQGALRALQTILKAAFSKTPFCVRWTGQGSVEEKAIWITEKEAVYFAQLPRDNFPGFERLKNRDFALCSPYRHAAESISVGRILWNSQKLEAEFEIPFQMFNRHAFVCGMTGAGKTNTMFHLLRSLNRPLLVIEPVKSEYYQLKDTFSDLQVFSMSVGDSNVLRVNPFWFPAGGSLQYHIDSVKTIISSAFALYAAMPNILEQCLYRIYRRCGWNISNSRNIYEGLLPEEYLYPTFHTLCEEIERYLDESDYEGENLSTYKGALLTRLQSFSTGTKGILFNHNVHPDYGNWHGNHVILELEELADDADKCIVMGVIMSQYYQYLKLRFAGDKDESLKHLIVIEEAHRLFKNVTGTGNPDSASSVEQMVETLSNMMAEIRAYGEGLLIVDQSPGKIAQDVLRNSCIKLIHRLDNRDDIEMVNSVLKMEESQEVVSGLGQGEAFICMERMEKAAKVHLPRQKGWNQAENAAHLEVEENQRLIDSSMADYLLTDEAFHLAMEQLLQKFINSVLYDSLYVNLNASLEKMFEESRRLIFSYGNGIEKYVESKDFMHYLLKRQITRHVRNRFPLNSLAASCCIMLLMRCVELYAEKPLDYQEISLLSEFREIQIYDRLLFMYRYSEERPYKLLRNYVGAPSPQWGLLIVYVDEIIKQCPDYKYEDGMKHKAFLTQVLNTFFIVSVSEDVGTIFIDAIKKIRGCI